MERECSDLISVLRPSIAEVRVRSRMYVFIRQPNHCVGVLWLKLSELFENSLWAVGRILFDVLTSFPVCDLAVIEEIAWNHCLILLPWIQTWHFLALSQYSNFSTGEERSHIDKE